MFPRAEANQFDSIKRALGQIKRDFRFRAQQGEKGFAIDRRFVGHIHAIQGNVFWRRDYLDRLAIFRGIRGAKDIVAADEFRKASFKRTDVKRSGKPKNGRQIIALQPRHHLIDEP